MDVPSKLGKFEHFWNLDTFIDSYGPLKFDFSPPFLFLEPFFDNFHIGTSTLPLFNNYLLHSNQNQSQKNQNSTRSKKNSCVPQRIPNKIRSYQIGNQLCEPFSLLSVTFRFSFKSKQLSVSQIRKKELERRRMKRKRKFLSRTAFLYFFENVFQRI